MTSVEIMLRFKEKDIDKKNEKAAFTVAWMKFLLNFQAQKTTQERIIVERFSSSAPSTQPSLLRQSTHLLVHVIHEKAYDIIQIDVSRKKLESSTSVASSSSKAETHRGKRQGNLWIWWRRAKSSDQAAKTNIDIGGENCPNEK